MVFISLRAGRYIHRFWGKCTLSLDSFCVFVYPVTCSSMMEIKVKDGSSLCTLVPDGEPHIMQSVSVSEDHRCSSISVKSTPEIEKKYVHRVYDAIAPILVPPVLLSGQRLLLSWNLCLPALLSWMQDVEMGNIWV